MRLVRTDIYDALRAAGIAHEPALRLAEVLTTPVQDSGQLLRLLQDIEQRLNLVLALTVVGVVGVVGVALTILFTLIRP